MIRASDIVLGETPNILYYCREQVAAERLLSAGGVIPTVKCNLIVKNFIKNENIAQMNTTVFFTQYSLVQYTKGMMYASIFCRGALYM